MTFIISNPRTSIPTAHRFLIKPASPISIQIYDELTQIKTVQHPFQALARCRPPRDLSEALLRHPAACGRSQPLVLDVCQRSGKVIVGAS